MIILYSDNQEIKLDVKDESHSYEAIMAEDTLNLYFSYPGYLEIPVGTWCDFYGKRYSLKKVISRRKVSATLNIHLSLKQLKRML